MPRPILERLTVNHFSCFSFDYFFFTSCTRISGIRLESRDKSIVVLPNWECRISDIGTTTWKRMDPVGLVKVSSFFFFLSRMNLIRLIVAAVLPYSIHQVVCGCRFFNWNETVFNDLNDENRYIFANALRYACGGLEFVLRWYIVRITIMLYKPFAIQSKHCYYWLIETFNRNVCKLFVVLFLFLEFYWFFFAKRQNWIQM